MMMVKNAGIASVKSSKLILSIGLIINIPTITNTAAVACGGTAVNIGASTIDP
jgi:hypothetical protein